jgi:uncharacterized membrane protein YraQ (UPF0718 family)
LGAVIFAVVIGLLMALIFRKEESEKANAVLPESEDGERSLWKTGLYFLSMVLILIFAAWGKPKESVGFWDAVYSIHWYLAGGFLILLTLMLVSWSKRDELKEWTSSTWAFARMILPLLFGGVLVAGALMGSPGSDSGLIPARYVAGVVGGNSIFANSGMGKGPALALLLAGPALSLPNMIVIRSIIGTKKTLVFIALVVVMATVSGMIFGTIIGGA